MRKLFVHILVATTLLVRSASAEPDRSATEHAIAQTLFDEGRALLDAGRIDEACEKLARSHRLDPGGGSLLNLALCHEKQGRVATAWTEYTDGLALARRDRHDARISFSEERLAAIQGRIARIVVRGTNVKDVTILLDGVTLERAELGVAIPVDPGEHTVQVSAPGRVTWSQTLAVETGKTSELAIPILAGQQREAPARVKKGQRVAGWISIGVGAAAVVAGTAFGIMALSKNAEADELCPSGRCTSFADQGASARAREDAVPLAWSAGAAISIGIIAVVIGSVLVLDSKPSRATYVTAKSAGLSFSATSAALTF